MVTNFIRMVVVSARSVGGSGLGGKKYAASAPAELHRPTVSTGAIFGTARLPVSTLDHPLTTDLPPLKQPAGFSGADG
jgi:hypothetical protein